MKIITFPLVLTLTFILGGCTLMAQSSMETNEQFKVTLNSGDKQTNIQQTTINLNLADLNQPHILRVGTSIRETQLTGQIKLDGKVIKTISNNQTEINLAPSLTQGRQVIEILGNYSPSYAAVIVEFTGTNTQVYQKTGGNGNFSQKIIIEVN